MTQQAQAMHLAASELRRVMANHPYLSHVQVVETASDIPEGSARSLKQRGIDPESVKVVYGDTGDDAFLVVDKLAQGGGSHGHLAALSDGLTALAQEAIGQHGLKAILGKHYEPVMRDVFDSHSHGDAEWQATAEQHPGIETETDHGKALFATKLAALIPDPDGAGHDLAMLKAEMLAALTVSLPGIAATPEDLDEMLERHREREGSGEPMTRRSDFQAWFDRSAVVGAQGQPLALYLHENDMGASVDGVSLSTEPGDSRQGDRKAYIAMQRPAPPPVVSEVIESVSWQGFDSQDAAMREARYILGERGYDGAMSQKPVTMSENERVRYENGDPFNFISTTGEGMTVMEVSEPDPDAYTTGFVSPVTTLYNEAGEPVDQFDSIDDFLEAHSTMSVTAFEASQVKTINNRKGVVLVPEDVMGHGAPDQSHRPEPWQEGAPRAAPRM